MIVRMVDLGETGKDGEEDVKILLLILGEEIEAVNEIGVQ